MRKSQQERVLFTGIGVCVKGRCVEKHLQVELSKEEEKERTKPPLSTQKNADYVLSHRKM